MTEMVVYKQSNIDQKVFSQVDTIAKSLLDYLNTPEIRKKLMSANKPKKSSSQVQTVFKKYLESLGFTSEKNGLFKNTPTSQLRPDYFLKIDKRNGILVEVERGKTTINNMDLLDFWKCHICNEANYLFILVPKELRQNNKMSPRKEFNFVKKRLSHIFNKGSYTNVKAAFIYGY